MEFTTVFLVPKHARVVFNLPIDSRQVTISITLTEIVQFPPKNAGAMVQLFVIASVINLFFV